MHVNKARTARPAVQRRSAAEDASASAFRRGPLDDSAGAAAQRLLADAMTGDSRVTIQGRAAEAIRRSPAMAAQRRLLGATVGPATQRRARSDEPDDSSPQAQLASRPNRTGLPDGLKSGIESLSGLSMDGVRVHYNSSHPAQLNALAFARGNDIHVAPGQERHLPHEAWHVVQQAQNRVRPTTQLKEGIPVNDDNGLEQEADVMGAKALQLQGLHGPDFSVPMQRSSGLGGTVQRYLTVGDRADNIRTFKAYVDLPHEYQEAVDEVIELDAKYSKLQDWISWWQVTLRMSDASDRAGLLKTLDRALVDHRTMIALEKGDRVYGLGGPERLPNTTGMQGAVGRQKSAPIQDNLNNLIVGVSGKKGEALIGESADFADWVETTKYVPEGGREPGKAFSPKSPDFKKLCKAGLSYHTKSGSTKTIHFDIAGLDMHAIVTKQGKAGSLITANELRAVYRQHLRQVQGLEADIDLSKIIFYYMGTPVPAPWVEDPELWKLYEPKFAHGRLHPHTWTRWTIPIILGAAAAVLAAAWFLRERGTK